MDMTHSSSSDSPPTEHPTLQISIFVLNVVGCLLLSVLVVTISLSHRLPRRDPVVNNFLYSWILLSALAAFDELTMIAHRRVGDTTDIRESVLILVTMVSTFNLSLHLWYTMRSAFHQCSARKRKIRTLVLVITPYIVGLIPLITLFNPAGLVVSGLFFLAFAVFNPAIDIALVVYYWRWCRTTRKANISGLMSLSFFLRLMAFSVYQSCYSALLYMGSTSPRIIWTESFHLVQNTFPILAFCVIGLHLDILSLWLPCLSRKRFAINDKQDRKPTNINSVGLETTLQGIEETDHDLQHLISRTDEDIRGRVFAESPSSEVDETLHCDNNYESVFVRTKS